MLKLALAGAVALAFSPQSFGTRSSFTLNPYIAKVSCLEGSGSAFRIEDGRWISVNHVTRMTNCQIDGKPITVQWKDERGDVSIISVPGKYRGGLKVDCSGFQDKQWYFGEGHAKGLSFHTVITVMSVKALARGGHDRGWDVLAYDRFIPGMSGGAVLNVRGEVVGTINAYGIFAPLSFSRALKDTPVCQG